MTDMRKLMIWALVFMASASFCRAQKADGAVTLVSESDSLSYAAGACSTEGLIPYVQQSYSVDTAYMADFVRGYLEGIKVANDPKGTAYIVGMQIAQMVEQRILPSMRNRLKSTGDSIEEDIFHQGFTAMLLKDHDIFTQRDAMRYLDSLMAAPGREWLEANAKKPGVQTTASGLQYKVLVKGNGPVPTAEDEVEVVYEGRLIDGTVFDSTAKHNEESDKFRLKHLIKGWAEALTLMPVGSKWEVYIPQELAYGSRQSGQIPPYSTLVFTMELKSIVNPPAKPEPLAPGQKTQEKTGQVEKK